MKTIKDRFWEKVKITGPDECWEWQAALTRGGYGLFGIGANRLVYVHRFIFEMEGILLTSKDFVCHKCDNRKCVNRKHLVVADVLWNARDSVAKGRNYIPTPRNGNKGRSHGMSKVTEEEVIFMRQSDKSNKELAALFDLSRTTVGNIRTGRTWKHVPMAQIEAHLEAGVPDRTKMEDLLKEHLQ